MSSHSELPSRPSVPNGGVTQVTDGTNVVYLVSVRQLLCDKETTATYHPLPYLDGRRDDGQDKDCRQEVVLDFVSRD